MFKKGLDIDKKKLLAKASDVKKDSLTRLKHFKTLIEHLAYDETHSLFKSHFSFIYHTFIDTFSTFDCNSKQKREDLECLLFIFEKIIIYNPELVKKRWQFYSITFVMQKLLHQNNTWQLRQEGVRLFVLWYQILCDETNPELQQMFGNLVPCLVPKSSLPESIPSQQVQQSVLHHQSQQQHYGHAQEFQQYSSNQPQLPIRLCSIEPLLPKAPNEQLPNDEPSFYLDNLLQYMVTQTTKPFWTSPNEARKNQESGFSFVFNMFKKIYLQHLFPNFSAFRELGMLNHPPLSPIERKTHFNKQQIDDDQKEFRHDRSGSVVNSQRLMPDPSLNCKSLDHLNHTSSGSRGDYDHHITLSSYQAIVIKWLTRILRQDMIPGQDELIKACNANNVDQKDQDKRDPPTIGLNDSENVYLTESNSTTIFQGIETSSREMDIARKVIGTWPDNIRIVHELFRRAFLNFYQPASMKRVVNVYKEWICDGGPNQSNNANNRNLRIGYTSFNDLLQTFVLNSSNAFLTLVQSSSMLDEQFEMCKRIMNIYRYMVMKIYMNTPTWEQLLNVMIMITEQLFPCHPPERKESTIGGRIAPAFFQTFIVSWIRANLYVHISPQMWYKFHDVMSNLVLWRELVEEWGTTMSSLTRVLVKHVYGLSLTDLPLERPQDRRRRPKALKSFSTAETTNNPSGTASNSTPESTKQVQTYRTSRSGSVRLPSKDQKDMIMSLTRSNSDGALIHNLKLYFSASIVTTNPLTPKKVRKIKSEYLVFVSDLSAPVGLRSESPNTDAIDGTSLKDSIIIEHDHGLDSHHSGKSSVDSSSISHKNENKRANIKANSDKCVLLGGSVRGWTPENSVIMWRRMLGLFGDINLLEDPENHLIAMKCLASVLSDFIKTRDNLGISVDNQSTPSQPDLIPPYTYPLGWLLEATHLPNEYQESRLLAYKLLCHMSIRRHDMELPQHYYSAFYEALHRGLTSIDPNLHSLIIANTTQLLSFELPGSTFLVHSLHERCRSMLINANDVLQDGLSTWNPPPKDHAIQILNTMLALHRPLKKLMVLKSESNNVTGLAAPGDLKGKVLETLMACNARSVILDGRTRSKSLCSLVLHVYQELCDKSDSQDVERLLGTLLADLQDSSNIESFRINCDLIRLFADHAVTLTSSRPCIVSSIIQIVSKLIAKLRNDECIQCLLICLEDWCMAVNKNHLIKPIEHEDTDTLSMDSRTSLLTIVLRSLESVIHDESSFDELRSRETRGSVNTSRDSDTRTADAQQFQAKLTNQTVSNPGKSQTNETTLYANHGERKQQLSAIKLACKVSHLKLVTYLGHFPSKQIGPATMSCCVSEVDFLSASDQQDQVDMKETGGLIFLVVDNDTILSFIGATMNSDGLHQPVHLIIRNLCGKYSWDISSVEFGPELLFSSTTDRETIMLEADSFQDMTSRVSMKYDSDYNDDGNSSSSMSSRVSSTRDCIGDLLNHLSNSATNYSSSSNQNMQRSKRNSAQSVSNPKYRIAQAEETMIALLTNQRFQELNHWERSEDSDRVAINIGPIKKTITKKNTDSLAGGGDWPNAAPLERDETKQKLLTLEQCRQLVQQLGYLSWEKRCKIDSLSKSTRLMRELKNLDNQPSRETHKIAVIYVASGQEDKNSILINSSGSRAFEEFVSGLGWEVNLANHLGFKGGLQSNKSTGETSPYYCNATTEVMFHVSTRIPINRPPDDESLNRKLRHLGNDEIHIVWSEHSRDYRRDIIPTEFGDVIIAIYPMLTFQGYYRVQISSKQDVPSFGPLFDNCIVHQTGLAPLVRATAINASRARRLKLDHYKMHYEERSRLIETIVQNHREKLSFEEFVVQLYGTSELKLSASTSPAEATTTVHQTLAKDNLCYT